MNNLNNFTTMNLLKNNKGKKVSIYQKYTESSEKFFSGIIEDAGNDYIILSNPTSGNWYLFLISNINYIVFEEEIN